MDVWDAKLSYFIVVYLLLIYFTFTIVSTIIIHGIIQLILKKTNLLKYKLPSLFTVSVIIVLVLFRFLLGFEGKNSSLVLNSFLVILPAGVALLSVWKLIEVQGRMKKR